MNANQWRTICARCQKPVEPGTGRFIGKGLVIHKQKCAMPTYVRTASKKRQIALGNRFLAPVLALAVVFAGSVDAATDWTTYDPHQGVIVWSDGHETPITCALNLSIGRDSEAAIRDGLWRPVGDTHQPSELRAIHWWRSPCIPGGDAPYRR